MIEHTSRKVEKENKFILFGKEYNLVFSGENGISLSGNTLYVKDKKSLDKWLSLEIKKLCQERLDYWYNIFEENIPYPKLKIRNMKTRWGVNNRRDNSVTLNSKLISYSIDKLDYVIIHELSHFVHFDHSRAFWGTVCKYCPEYKKRRNELKD